MVKLKCTGLNCPVQYNYADPKTCAEPEKCRFATFPQTNADRIRAMTDEELLDIVPCPMSVDCVAEECISKVSCGLCILRWLRSPAEESHE